MFKPSGLPLALLLGLFSIVVPPSTLAAQSEPKLIAQSGKGEWNRMMDEKCREWENSKSAPPSAAWTCANGRAATQEETNEAIDRFHKQGEQNAKRMIDQQNQS